MLARLSGRTVSIFSSQAMFSLAWLYNLINKKFNVDRQRS